MKSLLKSTSAIGAAGLLVFTGGPAIAQDKPQKMKIGISGSVKSWVAFAEQESSFENAVNAHYGTINLINDSEVHFRGNTKLDNGIRIDVIIQLEADQKEANTSGNTIDESYVKLTGAFGDLRLGSTHAAANVLANNGPVSGAFDHYGDPIEDFIVNPTGTSAEDPQLGSSDDMKIVYFTPSVGGFKLGASYTPSTTDNDAPIITGGANSGTTAATDWYDIGLAFERKFGDVDVALDTSYWKIGGGTDQEGYRVGGVIGFAGFSVGGSYADVKNEIDNVTAATSVSDYKAYEAGIGYESGPWEVALSFYHQEAPKSAATPGDDEIDHYMISGAYSIGPGVSLLGNVFMAEYQNETTAASLNNEGWGVAAGIKVGF